MKRVRVFDTAGHLFASVEWKTDSEVSAYTDTIPAGFTFEIIDITHEIEALQRVAYGRAAQQFGADMIAFIHSVNDGKQLPTDQYLAVMSDPTIALIERMLWNGSLDTVRPFIQSLPRTLYSDQEIETVVGMITDFLQAHGRLG